jgi:hypothetical protein
MGSTQAGQIRQELGLGFGRVGSVEIGGLAGQGSFVQEEPKRPPDGPTGLVRPFSSNQEPPQPKLPFYAFRTGKIDQLRFHPGGQTALEQAGLSQTVIQGMEEPRDRPVKPLATLENIKGDWHILGHQQSAALPLDGHDLPHEIAGFQNPVVHVGIIVPPGHDTPGTDRHHPMDYLFRFLGVGKGHHISHANLLPVIREYLENIPLLQPGIHTGAMIKQFTGHYLSQHRPGVSSLFFKKRPVRLTQRWYAKIF